MARPIKETPILYGKDAERFIERMNHPRKVSSEERERIRENYEFIKSVFVEKKGDKPTGWTE